MIFIEKLLRKLRIKSHVARAAKMQSVRLHFEQSLDSAELGYDHQEATAKQQSFTEITMTLMKSTMIALVFASSATCFAAPDATMQADNQAVNTACASDAQTAGCPGDVVGKGLLKCLWAYKKAHKDYKFSEACHAAMEKHHQDKKAGK